MASAAVTCLVYLTTLNELGVHIDACTFFQRFHVLILDSNLGVVEMRINYTGVSKLCPPCKPYSQDATHQTYTLNNKTLHTWVKETLTWEELEVQYLKC